MKNILLLLIALLAVGAGCQKSGPTAPTVPVPQIQTGTEAGSEKQPIKASFDTNDYLDEALKELETVDSL